MDGFADDARHSNTSVSYGGRGQLEEIGYINCSLFIVSVRRIDRNMHWRTTIYASLSRIGSAYFHMTG